MIELSANDLCTINKNCLRPTEPFGILDNNRLESAVGQQQFGYLYGSDEQAIASFFRSIIQDHPFRNGNKRTAVIAMKFLANNIGSDVILNDTELGDFIYELADEGGSKISVNAITNKLFGTNLDEDVEKHDTLNLNAKLNELIKQGV